MSSGITVSDEVKDTFNGMKVNKAGEEAHERIRLATLCITEDQKEIAIEKIYRQKDLDGVKDVYKLFQDLMKSDECRYILYDCHFETKESSNKEELVFLMWAPEGSTIKSKMKYASSKSALTKCFDGIKHIIQMNDRSDTDKSSFAKAIEKSCPILSIEGLPLCACDQKQDMQQKAQ